MTYKAANINKRTNSAELLYLFISTGLKTEPSEILYTRFLDFWHELDTCSALFHSSFHMGIAFLWGLNMAVKRERKGGEQTQKEVFLNTSPSWLFSTQSLPRSAIQGLSISGISRMSVDLWCITRFTCSEHTGDT